MNNNIHNQKKQQTPVLDSITLSDIKSINDGFVVPDGYFADLQHDVIAKLTQQQGEAPNNTWRSAFIRTAGFAAGFAAMVTLAIGLLNLTSQNNVTPLDNNEYIAELHEDLIYSMTQDDVLEVIWEQEAASDNDYEAIAEFNELIEILTAELETNGKFN